MKSFYFRIVMIAAVVVQTASAGAQSLLRLSGKIINQRNQPLAGATIAVKNQRSVPANADGFYLLNLPAGNYTMVISAVGYKTKEVAEVEVKAGSDNILDVVLEEKKEELGGVVVTSSRRQESTNTLLVFQKNNMAMTSGLAADFIRRTPDKNIGEALRRVSGASIQDNKYVVVRGLSDRYNAAMINGAALPSSEPDKKAFSFDIIPSQLIDNIIIYKTATPELTGEFAGGLVQVATKDIPTKNLLSVGFSLGINSQSTGRDFYSNPRGSTDWLGFDDGTRRLPASYPKNYGDFNRLPVADRYAIARDFNDQVYQEVNSVAAPIQGYNLTWANAVRGKNGGALGSVVGITYRKAQLILPEVDRQIFDFDGTTLLDYVDVQNKYSTSWGAVANVAYSKGKTKLAFKNLFNQLLEDNYYRRNGLNVDNLQDVQMRSSVLNQRSLYASQMELTHQFSNKFRFSGNINYSYNKKDQPDLRVMTFARPAGSSLPYSLNNRGNNTNRFWSDLRDQSMGYQVKLEMPFNLNGVKQVASIGGGSFARIRQFQAIIMGVNDPANPALMFSGYSQIFNKNNFGPGGFGMITDLQNINDKYFGVSVLSNAHVMLDNKIGEKIRLVWGARGEYFEQVVETRATKGLEVNSTRFDLLPSANLTYTPNTKTNLRVAASRTLARPEFREVAPFAFFDFEEIASTVGNPELKRSSIFNADIRYEFYPRGGEMLSVGGFFKSFTDPIELRLNSASAPTRRQYQYQNAESALLYGAEVEFRKSLGLKGRKTARWLENVYFIGNASLLFSEVTLQMNNAGGEKTGSFKRPLQGQSPYLLNAGFQYDGKDGWNASLLYNNIGQRLRFVGNENFGDIYEKPRNLLDLQVSKRIMKKQGELRFTVSDLLNQYVLLYEKPIFKEKSAYDESVDRIFTRYRPGSTFTLAFTYDINLK